MSIHRDSPKVFFPWERRRGLRGILGRARAGQTVLLVGVVTLFAVIRGRERSDAGVRATRASITAAMRAVDAWRADHDLTCPPALADVVVGGYLASTPRDAWGHPLRLACPGRRDPRGFDVSSDGPDGEPGGLDRVE